MTAYDIGTHVIVKVQPAINAKLHRQFGEVIGIVGKVHCTGLAIYQVELFEGAFVNLCHCGVRTSPQPMTPVEWADCVWRPKKCA